MSAGVPAGREVRRQFWLLVRAGVVRKQAAVTLGLNEDTGRDWFRQAGGVIPAFLTAPVSDRFLSFCEREEIFAGVERGDSIRMMAQEGWGRGVTQNRSSEISLPLAGKAGKWSVIVTILHATGGNVPRPVRNVPNFIPDAPA